MKIKKVRKKNIILDAYQASKEIKIETLEGTMTAQPGDWIIEGTEGERWPVRKDIFEKTYDVLR